MENKSDKTHILWVLTTTTQSCGLEVQKCIKKVVHLIISRMIPSIIDIIDNIQLSNSRLSFLTTSYQNSYFIETRLFIQMHVWQEANKKLDNREKKTIKEIDNFIVLNA